MNTNERSFEMELQEGLPQIPGSEATTLQLQPLSHLIDRKYDQALFFLRSTHTMSLPYKTMKSFVNGHIILLRK